MRRFNHVVATLLAISALNGFTIFPLVLSAEATEPRKTTEETGASGLGWLMGIVKDTEGAPLESTLVSAIGPSGVSLAVCDPNGRFEFLGLRPGTYLLRIHARGFAAAQRNVVQVRSGLATVHIVTLRRAAAASPAPAFLTAGFGSSRGFLGSPSSLGLVAQPDGSGPVDDDGFPGTSADESASATGRVTPHDDSEKAWRLRRARRSVLKDSVVDLVRDGKESDSPFVGQTLPMAADRIAMNPAPSGFPISGQLHLLTRATVHSSSELWSTDILPGQIAYVSLGGPEQQSHWGLRGAVRTGNAGTLALAGTYVTEMSDNHALALGLSYSRQNHQAAATDRSFPPSPVVLDEAVAPEEPSRAVGGVSVRGSWDVSPYMKIDYGVGLAKYEYLVEDELFSPNVVVTVEPLRRTRVRVALAQNMFAPGAEGFLPPSEGVWLPPETTFALLSPNDPLSAERSQHVEVSIEHDVARVSTVGVRRFYQDVDSQMVTLFGVRPQLPVSSSKHYYVMSGSGVSTEGWGLMLSHTLAGRVRGVVDYSLMHAEWAPWAVSGLSPQTVGVFRTGTERFHNVTTSVETEIPETATEIFVLYQVSTAFSVKDRATESLTSGFDSRFALRVKQALPFSPFEGSEWEVTVDIRSLFREPVVGASVYDELLVVNPPKQVVGGLVVHF